MKRLILGGAGLAALATAMLLIRPHGDPPQSRANHHGGRTQDASRGDPSGEDRLLSGKHRTALSSETTDPFQQQARKIASMPQDTERENATHHLAREWARNSPTAAERWAATREDPAERERALTYICLEVASQDPREAIRIARSHRLHPATLESIAASWAGADFVSAYSWAGELPEGEQKDRVVMRLLQLRATEAPSEAAALLSASPLSGGAQEEAAMTIVHQWILKDPEAARQWVELFPEGPIKDRANVAVQGMTAYRGRRDGK